MTTAGSKIKATRKDSKISRCMKAPIRILSKIRKFYLRSVSECTGQMSYGLYGCEAGYPPHLHYSCPDSLPKSYSVSSTASSYGDDFRHLLRAASANSITAKKIESELFRRQLADGVHGGVGRSQSVGAPRIGRIDEEEPSEFGDELNLKMEYHPRTRGHAVTRRRVHREMM